MSSKNKLQKFEQVATYPHVLQCFNATKPELTTHDGSLMDMRGQWSAFFKNEKPITLELACGGGEYTVALAEMYPDRNFIGVDIKGARIWRGATQLKNKGLENGAFLRARIENLLNYFAPREIAEIWITFPDPFLREGKAKKRLTSSRFLGLYKALLPENGIVHLKTDEPNLYQFTLDTIAEEKWNLHYHDYDIYASELPMPELAIKTYYETIDIANENKVKYIRFSPPSIAP